jgi:tRNA(fMet)-specific endonuclease VapC
MKGDPLVTSRLRRHRRDKVGVPQPVLAEIAYGIARLPRSRRRELLRERFEVVSGELIRVPWTDAVSLQFGEIKSSLERRGRRIEDFDAAIAAHALDAGAVLVTANVSDMDRVAGLVVEDWSAATS